MYKLQDITVSYKNSNNCNDYVVLNHINYSFPDKGLFFIIGKSGCGKSSLLNILEGLIKPLEGSVLYKNEDINKFNKEERNLYYKNEIGILFQSINLISNLTAKENLELAAKIKGIKDQNISELLNSLDLKYLENTKIEYLSGGEKQRVAFLRSTINEPNVLFCDEPTGAIDDESSRVLLNYIREYSKKHLVILVTHNKELFSNKDNVVELKEGKLFELSKVNEKRTNKDANEKCNNKKTFNFSNIMNIRFYQLNRKKISLYLFSFIFSLLFGFLTFSIYFGLNNAKSEIIKSYGDSYIFDVYNEISTNINDSPLYITKKERPEIPIIKNNLKSELDNFLIFYNFDFFIGGNTLVKSNEEEIVNYRIKFSYLDGNDIAANESFFEQNKILQENCNLLIEMHNEYLYKGEINNKYKTVKQEFYLQIGNKINKVYKEFMYLNEPTIYIDLEYFSKQLSTLKCNDINREFIVNYTWLDLVENAKNNEDLSGFSLKIVVFSESDLQKIHNLISNLDKALSGLKISNSHLVFVNSFVDLTGLLNVGLLVFSIIAIISTLSLLFFIITSIFINERKEIAILQILGANKKKICNYYKDQFILLTFLGILCSYSLYIGIGIIINKLIYSKWNLSELIQLDFIKPHFETIFLTIVLIFVMLFSVIFIISICANNAFKNQLAEEIKED